jgi:FMN phosphatase YigB (HAD superfamily)
MRSEPALRAVTLDANGTLVALADPVTPLREALQRHGVERSAGDVRTAFAAEVAYYLPRAHEGRDAASLASLRREAVRRFLAAADAELEPDAFVPDFLAAIRFEPLPGVPRALAELQALGLRLACVANWDVSLRPMLEGVNLAPRFDAIVSSAEAEAAKPDPAPLLLALERLGVAAEEALHCGDEPADREAAGTARMRFAEPPVSTLPARLRRKMT